MGIVDRILGRTSSSSRQSDVNASYGYGDNGFFLSTMDPRVIEFLKEGLMTATGLSVNVEKALRNPAMFRACTLISNSIGMLPFHLIDKKTKEKAKDHPLYKVLHRRPNDFQSAFDFRSLMQLRALVYKDAYALIVTSTDLRTGRRLIKKLIPLEPKQMTVKMLDDWTVRYEYQPKTGSRVIYSAKEIFHLRGVSLDGLHGFSLVEQAREAIGLALSAELASGRIMKNGSLVDGVLQLKDELSPEAYERLKTNWSERFSGSDNAGKTPLLEGGTEYKPIGQTAKDAQMSEFRKLQIEEISRVTGVPRPLMMIDETSWGSGIQALGQFFVAYALGPWFEAWQQATERCLLHDDEADQYEAKFNPGALLRGSLTDQADFMSKALGAGGHAPWMHVEEVRDMMDLPEREAPPHTMMGQPTPEKTAEEEPPPPPPKKRGKKKDEQNDDDE